MKKQMLRITDKSVCIYLSGRSDYYDGALVQGAFRGSEYYRKEDVKRALCKIHLDSLREDDLEYIRHACKPYRVSGHIVQ